MNDESDFNTEARFAAQRLAFAPLMFQACRALRDFGILEALQQARRQGLTAREAVEKTQASPYAAALLLEAGLATPRPHRGLRVCSSCSCHS